MFVWLFFKVSNLIKKYHFEYVDFIIFYFWQWRFQLNSIQYIFRNIYKLDILLSSLLVFCYLEFFLFYLIQICYFEITIENLDWRQKKANSPPLCTLFNYFYLHLYTSCNPKILFVLIVNPWKLMLPLCKWM